MTFRQSLLFFGGPGLAILIGLYVGVPIAVGFGIPLIIAWSVALWLPIVLLLALVLYRFRRVPLRALFGQRFRFRRLQRQEWLVVLAAFVLIQALELLLSSSGAYVWDHSFVSTPSIVPALFDPRSDIGQGFSTFFGVPVEGNWWLIAFWLGWLVINIGGEEVLWRGYALPLQERYFGRFAWIMNGLCWNLLVHAFMYWNFLTLLPISLAIPYLVQRYKNTWIGVYIHGAGNLLVLADLVPSIAGWL